MKKYFKYGIVLVFISVILSSCAGTSSYMKPATPIEGSPPPDKAVVYFMRPSGMGFAINFQIWDSDYFVGLSQAKSYFAYQCDPGNHLFMGFSENKVALEADLEGGKSYYVGTNVRMGMFKARMEFTPVTRGSDLWNKVENYKSTLNFIAASEEDRAKWEAGKKAEIPPLIDYFTNGEGKKLVLKLNREDGR